MATAKHDAAKAAPTTVYAKGEKKYAPRVEHNLQAWEKVQSVLVKNKNRATPAQLKEVLGKHFSKPDQSHYDFVNYMVRGKHLVVVNGK
jgi:hypothetical protein